MKKLLVIGLLLGSQLSYASLPLCINGAKEMQVITPNYITIHGVGSGMIGAGMVVVANSIVHGIACANNTQIFAEMGIGYTLVVVGVIAATYGSNRIQPIPGASQNKFTSDDRKKYE